MEQVSYKDILKEAPNFFEAYQSSYALEKRSGALNIAYIAGVCVQKLRARALAGRSDDDAYVPIYENQAQRGIINYGVNILVDPYRSILTSLIKNTPGYKVFPTIEDDKKSDIAEIATKILQYHDDSVFVLGSKLEELYSWAVAPVATAYAELLPEDTDLSYQVAGTEEDEIISKDGVAVDKFNRVVDAKITTRKQKRLQFNTATIWDVACSEDSTDGLIDGCTIQIRCIATTIRGLRKWAKDDEIEKILNGLQKTTPVIEDSKTSAVRAAKGMARRSAGAILSGDDRQIKTYHVYHKADEEYPNGWYGITDDKGNILAWFNTLPVPGIMPYTQLNTNSLDPGEFIKRSVFDDARGPQVLYQGVFDSRASHAMFAANPPLLRVKGVVLSSDAKRKTLIYPKQGEVEEVDFEEPWRTAVMQNPALANVLKPRPMEIAPVTFDVDKVLEECKQSVLNVTGQNLANVGQFPNANISGVSVQEQVSVDAMGQLPMISLMNDFWKRFRKKLLKAVSVYYTAEQISFMLNELDISRAGKFKLEDLDDSFDVKIDSTDGLPQTPKGLIEFYAQIMQLAPTMEEKNEAWVKIRELIAGYGLIDEGLDIEERLAEIENKMILEDKSLIADMNVMVPMIDSIGNPVVGQDGIPIMEPKARQRVRSWANRMQNEVRHVKVHRPLTVGPEILKNGIKITQLMAWHLEKTEENFAIKQGGMNGMGLQEPGMPEGGAGAPVPANVPQETGQPGVPPA